ncbi:hypothetical protein Celaphus_00013650 [Cervus elaphus hippelaphus]|uniref:Uncharacterized protein n=1 Tax=Cervus elaphus hippelaphus TaxID=46360 RepID=A0A212CCR9_CEREH|nr:hypothetical protein Celaphus_00013650 [Cervus elaphus hippelaphus]
MFLCTFFQNNFLHLLYTLCSPGAQSSWRTKDPDSKFSTT